MQVAERHPRRFAAPARLHEPVLEGKQRPQRRTRTRRHGLLEARRELERANRDADRASVPAHWAAALAWASIVLSAALSNHRPRTMTPARRATLRTSSKGFASSNR